jgi:hypothetical protein
MDGNFCGSLSWLTSGSHGGGYEDACLWDIAPRIMV